MAVFEAPGGVRMADLVETIGAEVASFYDDAETRILAQIEKRARKQLGRVPDTWARLEQVRALRAETLKVLSKVPDDLADRIIGIASTAGAADAVARLKLAKNLPTGPLEESSAVAVATLAADLQSVYEAVETRVLRWEQDAWQQLTAGVVPGVLLGVDRKLTAQQGMIARWLAGGVPGFVDKSGRAWQMGAYAEMATRTATRRAFTDAAVQRMSQAGVNLVTPVVGSSACQPCAQWAGKVLSTDGTPPGVVNVEHATEDRVVPVRIAGTREQWAAAGAGHPNCRCQLVAYLPGLSVPAASTTYDPTLEQARDRQRAVERRIRKKKRELTLTDSASRAHELKSSIRDSQAQLRKLTATYDLPRKRYREQLWFSTGKAA